VRIAAAAFAAGAVVWGLFSLTMREDDRSS
jgi:hypothetical protein